jgi:hypothetical protein
MKLLQERSSPGRWTKGRIIPKRITPLSGKGRYTLLCILSSVGKLILLSFLVPLLVAVQTNKNKFTSMKVE